MLPIERRELAFEQLYSKRLVNAPWAPKIEEEEKKTTTNGICGPRVWGGGPKVNNMQPFIYGDCAHCVVYFHYGCDLQSLQRLRGGPQHRSHRFEHCPWSRDAGQSRY